MSSHCRAPGRVSPARLAAASLALCIGLMQAAVAADEDEGRFDVRTAYTELIDGVYYLNADIDYDLSPSALEALRSGVTLTIEIQIDIARNRRWLWKQNVAELRQRYQLSFHPLAERYIVRNANTDDVHSFASYRDAIRFLGQVSDLPVIDSSVLESRGRYDIRMRVVIDVKELPSPLNVVAFLFSDWELVSEWYRWVLRS